MVLPLGPFAGMGRDKMEDKSAFLKVPWGSGNKEQNVISDFDNCFTMRTRVMWSLERRLDILARL